MEKKQIKKILYQNNAAIEVRHKGELIRYEYDGVNYKVQRISITECRTTLKDICRMINDSNTTEIKIVKER